MDVTSVAFSPDGKLLASGSLGWDIQNRPDGTLRLWNVDRQNQIGLLKTPVDSFAFSPSGRTLASTQGSDEIYFWDVDEQKQKSLLKSPDQDQVITVAFSPDGRLLASGHHDGVRLWSVSEQEQLGMLQGGHKDIVGRWSWDGGKYVVDRSLQPVRHVVFSPDGKWLASEHDDGIVLLWGVNLQAGEVRDFIEITPKTD